MILVRLAEEPLQHLWKTQTVLDALQQTLFCGLHKGFRDFGNIKKVK